MFFFYNFTATTRNKKLPNHAECRHADMYSAFTFLKLIMGKNTSFSDKKVSSRFLKCFADCDLRNLSGLYPNKISYYIATVSRKHQKYF